VLDAPVTTDREAIALLREALERAQYTTARLEETLELDGPFSLDWSAMPVYRRQLPRDDPFTAVTTLFLLGEPVPLGDVERAVAPLTAERLADLGLVLIEDGHALASLTILPWSGLLIASDVLEKEIPPTRSDHVLSVIPGSVTLADLTPRRPIGSTLDVGVGCGVLSLLAASHSQRVVGVDVNPRAIRFAELNLALNGISNVELRLSDVYEAVEGERFDLIVSNPPYVVSPDAQYAFRDSGRPADSFCEDLARGAPQHLTEGGKAILLLSWVHRPDEDWTAPLRRWVDGSGCDALALHMLRHEPLGYAALWTRPFRWDPIAYDRAIERWLENLRALRIEAISWGALVLRRREGTNWFGSQEAAIGSIDAAGEQLDRMIAANDHLAELGDRDGLLGARLRLADEHRIEQTLTFHEGQGTVQQAVLRLDGGFNFSVALSRDGFQLVSLFDGRPLDEVVDEVAARIDDATREQLLSQTLDTASGLYKLGFLVRADGGSRSA
jgi:methylase of polypeptide subunit release factors